MSKELQYLLDLTQKKRLKEYYAKTPAKKLLHLILHEIEIKHYGHHRSWELLTELLAQWIVKNVDLTLSSISCKSFYGLDMKQNKDLFNQINDSGLFSSYYEAAQKDPWDHLGEIYQDDLRLTGLGQNMTPRPVVEFMLRITFGDPWKFEAKLFSYYSYLDYVLRYYAFNQVRPAHLEPMEFPMQTQLDI